ncbi:hypothetical protein SAMN00768000_0183 [Sulfobacillus thermosulfidooxidans DSM 9293]|uniref:Uncharacterized protein n=1 Tax=Sulfobacillus thermosulfidooxidans (strain DSM 9293 / VKM B-1269 / AT-1) TaxID=929705 RepID=A0A1W1W6P8_SULTA|nr:hypothetical protein [Sulfobacillus thermosulfidooxidans]SMC01956.1 hypothetical protein SAMN00768000_0183 [Sulfobacillus thermosulfidooxidans DSM 9293]
MATVNMYFWPMATMPGIVDAVYSHTWESADGRFRFAQSDKDRSLIITDRTSGACYQLTLDAGENPTTDEEIITLLRTLLDQKNRRMRELDHRGGHRTSAS